MEYIYCLLIGCYTVKVRAHLVGGDRDLCNEKVKKTTPIFIATLHSRPWGTPTKISLIEHQIYTEVSVSNPRMYLLGKHFSELNQSTYSSKTCLRACTTIRSDAEKDKRGYEILVLRNRGRILMGMSQQTVELGCKPPTSLNCRSFCSSTYVKILFSGLMDSFLLIFMSWLCQQRQKLIVDQKIIVHQWSGGS